MSRLPRAATRSLAFTLLIGLAACVSPAHLTPDEVMSVREMARKTVLASGIVSGPVETELIRNVTPQLSYYFLSRPYADYTIQWQTPTDDRIVVRGRGNILKLEGADVRRLPKLGT